LLAAVVVGWVTIARVAVAVLEVYGQDRCVSQLHRLSQLVEGALALQL
jgi:hypothetical protein